jgi:Protein of unknown function (DUF3574).
MKLEIYLPIEHKEAANHAIRQCIDSFGGCTVVKGDGHWKNDNGKLYSEPVKVVSVYSTKDQDYIDMQHIARQYKQAAKQEAVLLAVNGEPEFI